MMTAEMPSLTQSEQSRVRRIQALNTNRRDSVPQLISMLNDPSWVVRRAVVDSLALAGDAAVSLLCEALREKRDNESKIAATIDALVASNGTVDDVLVETCAGDKNLAVLADVAQILGRRRSHRGVRTLIELAKNADDNVAVIAIEALGRIGGRTAVEALIASTKSGNFFRTFAAIDVLGRSEDPRVVVPLEALLVNPIYAPEAARALARTGEKSAVRPLMNLLNAAGDPTVRLAALSLWELRTRFADKTGGITQPLDDVLTTGLSGSHIRRLTGVFQGAQTSEAIAICHLLGVTKNPEAAVLLVSALQSTNEVALAAAEALKNVGPLAEASLSQAIRNGDSQRRKILLPSVTRLTEAEDVTVCLKDQDADVRALACEALGRIGNVSVVDKIFEALEDPSPRVVHAATASIQSLGSRSARIIAIRSCESENKNVRRAALRILGYFGDESALEPMVKALGDDDFQVREAAIQGLPYVEGAGALEALIEASKSDSERIRALAMRSLGQLPKLQERVFAILLRGLRDPDAWVRYYSVQAIGRAGKVDAVEDLEELLVDSAGQVRVAVIEALSKLGAPRAHEVIQKAAQAEEIDIRRAALLGLGLSHKSEDLPILINAASDGDVSIRLMALSSLVSFTSPVVIGVLRAATYDGDEQVSSAAINFLAARPELEATEGLVELLERETTREKAKTALLLVNSGRIGGLLVSLEESKGEITETLMAILARIDRSPKALGLQAAMKLNNTSARKAAASAIATRNDADLRLLLEEASSLDPDPEVRAICRLLMEI